jgi:hypothetical protein
MNYTSDFPAGKSAAAGALAATQSIWMRQLSPTDIDFAVDKILFVLRVRARFGFSIAFTDMTTTLTKFSDARGLPLSSPFDAIDGVEEHDLWCFYCEPRLWMILIRRGTVSTEGCAGEMRNPNGHCVTSDLGKIEVP